MDGWRQLEGEHFLLISIHICGDKRASKQARGRKGLIDRVNARG